MKSTKTRRLTTTIAAVAIAACTFATLDLAVGDQFKVYNLVNNGYFPSGTNNDCIITEADTYTIEYETKAPSFTVTNSAGVIVYQ